MSVVCLSVCLFVKFALIEMLTHLKKFELSDGGGAVKPNSDIVLKIFRFLTPPLS